MQRSKLLLFVLVVLLVVTSAFKTNSSQARYHAVFIYNFTKYIEWPASNGASDFTITVVKDQALYDALSNMAASKQVNGRHIQVNQVSDASKVEASEIVILGGDAHFQFNTLQKQVGGQSTLVITSKEGYAEKGAMINFVLRGGKVKFEMNEAAVNGAGLKVSTNLKSLAIMVWPYWSRIG